MFFLNTESLEMSQVKSLPGPLMNTFFSKNENLLFTISSFSLNLLVWKYNPDEELVNSSMPYELTPF
jgi:hypothetical protein